MREQIVYLLLQLVGELAYQIGYRLGALMRSVDSIKNLVTEFLKGIYAKCALSTPVFSLR